MNELTAVLDQVVEAYGKLQAIRSKPAASNMAGARADERDVGLPRSNAGKIPKEIRPRRLRASTASGILLYVLRKRGWLRDWKAGKLTGRQHLEALEDVRQYSRAYLRQEVQEWVDEHLAPVEPLAMVPRIADAVLNYLTANLFIQLEHFVGDSIHAGVKALKGAGQLTERETISIVKAVEFQAPYLNGFRKDFAFSVRVIMGEHMEGAEAHPMSPAQIVARAEMYGNAPWTAAVNAGRGVVLEENEQESVFIAERRVHFADLESHHPCGTCLEQSDLGWQPIGTLNEIGDSECLGNCDCYFEWQDDGAEAFVSPWGRHNPKNFPPNVPGYAYPENFVP